MDIKKLLEIAEGEGDAAPLNDVERFKLALNIRPSKYRVKNLVIYWTYLKWTNEEPVKRQKFFSYFKEFERASYNGFRYMGIDKEGFVLSKEDYREMLQHLRKEMRTWKRRKKQKGHRRNIRGSKKNSSRR